MIATVSAVTIYSRNNDKLSLVIWYEQRFDAVANDKTVDNDAWTKRYLTRLEYMELDFCYIVKKLTTIVLAQNTITIWWLRLRMARILSCGSGNTCSIARSGSN